MLMNYLQGHPLAMLPTKVTEISDFLRERGEGIKLALDSVKDDDETMENNVVDGIATVNIFGSISKRMNLLQKTSGGVSVELLNKEIQALCKDDEVKGILLNIDSPGGSVHGIKDIADMINSVEKPVVAYSDGLMASAAYWIASGADMIITSETATVGSIGVVTVHTDTSKADSESGIKKTVLTAGKYKAMGNPNEPLEDEARAEIQSKLDQFYTIFVENVAENRNVSPDAILKVADGKTFVGKNAPSELVDLTGSIEVAYNQLINLIKEGEIMTIEEFKKTDDYNAMVKGFENEKAEFEATMDAAVLAERNRCLEIFSIEGGHEDLKLEAIKEGSNADSLYAKLYKAELSKKTNETKRLEATTEPVEVNSAAPEKVSSKVTADDFMALVNSKVEKGTKKSAAILQARRENPEGFAAYLQANQ